MAGIRLDTNMALSAPRTELISAVKSARQEEWASTSTQLLEQINEISGRDVCIRLSQATDVLVSALFRRALARAAQPSVAAQSLHLFAVGGYGRTELNPHSDLDVLVLVNGGLQAPAHLRAVYQDFSTLLWDAGFKVGGSLRTLRELEDMIWNDFVTATAVLEQRPLVAGEEQAECLRALLERFRSRRARHFLLYKLEELQSRQGKAGASLFRMEPDLKTNPGGLRDVQLLSNIGYILTGERQLRTLSLVDGMEREDIGNLYVANDHLLKLRSLQHFHHGRAQDVWALRDQLRCAQQLGYSGASRLRAVEVMMRDHYRRVRHVVQMVELTQGHLNHHGHLGRKLVLIKTRRQITPFFAMVGGQIYCSDKSVWSRGDLLVQLLQMCREAQRAGHRLSYVLRRTCRQHVHVIDDDDRTHPLAGRLFLEILADTPRLPHILTDMHDGELLGALLPEFGNVTCLMQFDSYHHYTIDQHTLFALGNLAKLWMNLLPGLPGMREILRRGQVRKELLALALLMHDAGKYMGRGHSERGAVMVTHVGMRFGLPEADVDLLHWLVLYHTRLSVASRSRDITDPVFLSSFADMVGEQKRLDLLYLLTYCDTLAVAEGILTGWQEALLSDLYFALSAELRRRSTGAELPTPHERFRASLLAAKKDEPAVESFLSAMPPSYFYQAQPEQAPAHLELFSQHRQGAINLRWQEDRGSVSLDLMLPDRVGIFADACAILSARDLNIEDAAIWSCENGEALVRMRLETHARSEASEGSFWQNIEEHLARCLKDAQYARGLLEARRKRKTYAQGPSDSAFNDPSVKIDQRSSRDYTILDVQEKDTVGLLSDLCRIIADHGCWIGFASIHTMGDVALDTFYVRKNRKRLDDHEAQALREAIENAYDMPARAKRSPLG